MGYTERSVSELVGKIERGELQLPEMQRRYVWTKTKVRDLLDSLYRGYPSGLLLVWEAPQDSAVVTQDFAISAAESSGSTPWLLLDGQQRLTSLSAVLRGDPIYVKGRKTPIEILFNLDHPDELTFITEVKDEVQHNEDDVDDEDGDDAEDDPISRANRRAFVVSGKQVAALPNWINVSDVFTKSDAEILKEASITDLEDPNYTRYSERLQQLRGIQKYSYRIDVLEPSMSYEEVTEIFVRVNSLGAKLRSSDLALAQITAKWHGSLELFNKFQQEIKNQGFALDLGVHLKVLVALITNQSRFKTVGSLTTDQLQDGWERAKKAMHFAANFTVENCKIDSPTLLSSPFLLVAAAYWADQRQYSISDHDSETFRKWFLIANAKGRYSRGSSETILDQDLSALRKGGGGDELLKLVLQQAGRLHFTPADLDGRTSRSGAFKTLFTALRKQGARDWETQLQISPKHTGKQDKIEFHHIFPKAFLKNTRPELETRVVNDMANLAFVGAKTNKKISSKSPAEYGGMFDPELLAEQLVEFPDGVDQPDRYEDFLQSRREAIADTLNIFLGVNPDAFSNGLLDQSELL